MTISATSTALDAATTAAADQRIGRPVAQIDTPALLLDLDRFERNARRLAETIRAGGKAWRPHSKGHKSPWLAKRQIELGAMGVTCAKVGEAEVMVEHGISRVLIANELASTAKLARVARLLARAEVIVCADDSLHIRLASEVGVATGVRIPMLVDLDIGMERTGARPGRPGLELARAIDDAPGLRFAGLMGYEGHVLTAWPPEERRRATAEAIAGLVETRRLVEADGIPVDIVSGSGSGNHVESASLDGVTELQAGGACLMDRFYGEECHLGELGFEYALTVLTTVTSRPTLHRAITDAGFKTLSSSETTEHPSVVLGRPDLTIRYLSAEHGVLIVSPAAAPIGIGDRLELLPDYHDTTTFRHDAFVGTRDGVVEAIIPLLGRGRLD